MSKFKDRLGREWDVTLTMGTIGKVRKSNDIDLGKILGNQKLLVNLLYEDVDLLGQVLYAILEKQIVAVAIDADGFADGFDGPALQRARDALAVAITNFSLPPKAATAASESLKEVMGATDELTAATISNETAKAVLTLNNAATNSPVSAA